MATSFVGTAALEGVRTRDKRIFNPGAFTWPKGPIPLGLSADRSHRGTSQVGKVLSLTRDGDRIRVSGVVDDGPALDLLKAGKGGVSLVLADAVLTSGVNLDREGNRTAVSVFSHARIEGLDLVATPAFADAAVTIPGAALELAAQAGDPDGPVTSALLLSATLAEEPDPAPEPAPEAEEPDPAPEPAPEAKEPELAPEAAPEAEAKDPKVSPHLALALAARVKALLALRQYSAEEREAMADKGEALPDGSFPIADAADLRNAIQAHGRASDIPRARRHIVARAKALGLADQLPEGWAD